jgi:uncharacterized protein YprB with RNaseH-like and TPR domain
VITASFRHIAGIGPLRERQLWFSGVRSWAELPQAGEVLSPRLDGKLREGVAVSVRKLAEGDLDFFARALPQTEHWRLLPQVIDDAAFVDIEAEGEKVTVAGVLDRHGLASFREDLSGFRERSRKWRALVTFNGTAFDLPILRRVLPLWEAPAVHIDLCHVYLRPLAELGYNRLLQRCRMPAPELQVTDRGAMLYDVSRAVDAACLQAARSEAIGGASEARKSRS